MSTGVAAAITSVSVLEAFCAGLLESVTLKVRATPVVLVLGVPLSRPLVVLNDRPAGRVPVTDQV